MESNEPSPDARPPKSDNPYASFDTGFAPAPSPDLVVANLESSTVESASTGVSRRWWTPIAIVCLTLPVFFIASLIMAVIAVVVVHGEFDIDALRQQETFIEVSRSRIGLMIMVVAPQIMMVVPALLAAKISPVPIFRRLSLVRGHWPVWAWIAAALATPLIGLISSVVVGLFMEESESLKEMSQIFRDHGTSGFLIPLALMIGLTPAVCEELLFRGYIQTRLAFSLNPWIGILASSILFAVFHMDPVHVIAVFPMGMFLGWVSWRSGSLFPAMMGHFVNNVISVVAVVTVAEADMDTLALPAAIISLSIIGLGILGLAATSVASYWFGPPSNPEEGNPEEGNPEEGNPEEGNPEEGNHVAAPSLMT